MSELRGKLGGSGGLVGKFSGGTGGGFPCRIGPGLKIEENVLSVDTADAVEEDNTKPVTSAAVFTEIGNIEALLAAI